MALFKAPMVARQATPRHALLLLLLLLAG